MQISQLDANANERFSTCHALHHPLPSAQTVVVLAGLVTVDLQAPGWANENATPSLFRSTLELVVALPQGLLQPGQRFQIDQAVPYLNLAAIEGSTNVSWAIHGFEVSCPGVVDQGVTITAQLAVSMTGEILRRVGYHLTLLGRVLD